MRRTFLRGVYNRLFNHAKLVVNKQSEKDLDADGRTRKYRTKVFARKLFKHNTGLKYFGNFRPIKPFIY